MCDGIVVTVVQCTGNLPRKLSGPFLLELAMRDDVVKHLTTIYVLEQHVVVVRHDHDVPHAAYIGVSEQSGDCSLANRPDFLAFVVITLFIVWVLGISNIGIPKSDPWNDLDRDLRCD